MKSIALLGSTGSIGVQTLDVVRDHPESYKIVSLACNENIELMERQIEEFHPLRVCVVDAEKAKQLRVRVSIPVLFGKSGLAELCKDGEVDIVVNAVVGACGIEATYEAIRHHKIIGLANKESYVAAGCIMVKELVKSKAQLIPIDSEHSAIFQCLQGQDHDAILRLILTCSGGPFFGKTTADLGKVSLEQALQHPTWKMGAKITIDSATLMNKGLEVIEAHYLFGIPLSKIDIVIHPQSIIHSMVEFVDGVLLAQMGVSDMRIPVQYALSYPSRMPRTSSHFDFRKNPKLTFDVADFATFECLRLAYDAAKIGHTMPAVLNAANEVANEAFRDKRIDFLTIPRIVKEVMKKHTVLKDPTLVHIFAADQEARITAEGMIP